MAGFGSGRLPINFIAPPPDPLTKSYQTKDLATEQQAGDYSNIMQGYKDLLAASKNGNNFAYSQSPDSIASLAMNKNLGETGGYSTQDIQDLRARGISPIRSVYANAQRNVDRNRVLQGGYSPSYNAATAKMAREQSEQIANQMTNVNAGIAENVARNKIGASSTYGSLAQSENALRNSMKNDPLNAQANALQGMTSLYGTTPALVNTFGNQALQGASLQNEITQGNKRNNLSTIGTMMAGLR